MVQWLSSHGSTAGAVVSMPGLDELGSHRLLCVAKKKKKPKMENLFLLDLQSRRCSGQNILSIAVVSLPYYSIPFHFMLLFTT